MISNFVTPMGALAGVRAALGFGDAEVAIGSPGPVLAALMVGLFGGVSVGHRLIQRFGRKGLLVACVVLTAGGRVVLATAGTWWLACVGEAVLGAAVGVVAAIEGTLSRAAVGDRAGRFSWGLPSVASAVLAAFAFGSAVAAYVPRPATLTLFLVAVAVLVHLPAVGRRWLPLPDALPAGSRRLWRPAAQAFAAATVLGVAYLWAGLWSELRVVPFALGSLVVGHVAGHFTVGRLAWSHARGSSEVGAALTMVGTVVAILAVQISYTMIGFALIGFAAAGVLRLTLVMVGIRYGHVPPVVTRVTVAGYAGLLGAFAPVEAICAVAGPRFAWLAAPGAGAALIVALALVGAVLGAELFRNGMELPGHRGDV